MIALDNGFTRNIDSYIAANVWKVVESRWASVPVGALYWSVLDDEVVTLHPLDYSADCYIHKFKPESLKDGELITDIEGNFKIQLMILAAQEKQLDRRNTGS